MSIQVDMHFEAPLSEWQIGVFGSVKAAFIDIFRDILVVVPNDNTHAPLDILRTSRAAITGHLAGTLTSGLRTVRRRLTYGNDEVFERWINACLQGGVPSGISSSDGLEVVRMQHAILARAG